MTNKGFLAGLGRVAVLGVLLALLLWFVFGARWLGFYGAATIALATLPFVTRLLWRRLSGSGRARWLSLLYALPVALLAAVQIGYWVMFFATGATDPSLGVVREMLRPMFATAGPWGLAALLVSWGFVLRRALRAPAAAD